MNKDGTTDVAKRKNRQFLWSCILGAILLISFFTFKFCYNRALLAYPETTPIMIVDQAGTVDHEHYSADACIVCCIDDRFNPLLQSFAKAHGYDHVDWVKVAGGAKDLFRHEINIHDSVVQDYLVDQICKSIELHHTKKVVLIEHVECGGFGGEKDPNFYAKDLQRMKPEVERLLREKNYLTPVTTYLAKFDGMYEVK